MDVLHYVEAAGAIIAGMLALCSGIFAVANAFVMQSLQPKFDKLSTSIDVVNTNVSKLEVSVLTQTASHEARIATLEKNL